MDAAAAELLRSLRGERSQIAWSRRLGYRSNVAADWEHGRRWPTAGEALRAAGRAGIDVSAALERFHPASAARWSPESPELVHAWLSALQGSATAGELAERAAYTRFQVGRWLSGRTRPRLPDFLRLVEAMTGRASDLVAELVDIASIPSLADVHARRRATRRLAYEHPYAAGALTLIEVGVPPGIPAAAYVARALRIPEPAAAEVLEALADAGVARDDGQGWRVVAPLTVDVRASPDDVRGLKRTWARVALERLDAPDPRDLHAFNLITVSAADLERVRELQRAWFRELRALVAASAPSEVAAVVVAQLVVLADGSGCAAPP